MNPNTDLAYERETTISFCEAEPLTMSVWTSQRRIGLWMEKVCSKIGVELRKTSRPSWEATVPLALLTLRAGIRPPMSEERKAKQGAILAAARQAQKDKKA